MLKNTIAIFFTVLLMSLTAAPTIVSMVDDSVDISMFFSTSEEEEKETKSLEDLKILFSESNASIHSVLPKPNNVFRYQYKKYTKPHLNLISPPPEHNIL